VAFHEVEFEIIDKDGQRWVTAKQLAEALGCPYKTLLDLISEMTKRGELKEGVHFNRTPLPTAGGVQKTMIISQRGAVRISMRSDAPRAAEFRDFAETVLVEVMTTGRYEDPRLPVRYEQRRRKEGHRNQALRGEADPVQD
jgi:prophage antirepressor-like protein